MNPQQMITVQAVDNAFYFILAISVVMLILITVMVVYCVIRYSRRRYPVPLSQKDHNIWLEVVWTTIPTLLVMAMFWFGWEGYLSLQRIPDGAIQVDATARMWSWNFKYETGKSSDKLYVPVGTPVKVKLESLDVLHAFYVPAFRVKRDIVPGMTTWVWFNANEPGSYNLFCAEYCGVGHSAMITTVEALPKSEFDEWVKFEKGAVSKGQALLDQYGCLGCHSLDGSESVGPTFDKIGGRNTVVERNGKNVEITADRDYLRTAIVDPGADIVKDFPPVMPSFADAIPDQELETILDYLEKGEQPAGLDGETIIREQGCLGCHSTDGSQLVGPSFKAIFGRETQVEGKGSLMADESYLMRALTAPEVDVVEGFPPIMPAYDQLTEDELKAIVEYLKGIK